MNEKEYKEKLDFLMRETESSKTKVIIAKMYVLNPRVGEALLDCIKEGVFSNPNTREVLSDCIKSGVFSK